LTLEQVTLLVVDFADQDVDDGVAECPTAVGVTKEIGFDQELLFIIRRVDLNEGVVTKLEIDGFTASSVGASIGHVAVDVA
jgi:hypothetical protein